MLSKIIVFSSIYIEFMIEKWNSNYDGQFYGIWQKTSFSFFFSIEFKIGRTQEIQLFLFCITKKKKD